MIFVAPLTSGVMLDHAIAMIKFFMDKIVFFDRVPPTFEHDETVKSLNKPAGLKKIFWAFSLKAALQILAEARRQNPKQVVFLNGEFLPFIFALALCAKVLKVKLTLTWHDVTPHVGSKVNWLLWALSFLNILVADQVIVHSTEYLLQLKKWLPKKQVLYIPLPPLSSFNTAKPAASNPLIEKTFNVKKYFVFLGRLEAYKGVVEIIPVFLKNQELNLLIVGTGAQSYVEQIKRLSDGAKNVFFFDQFLTDSEFMYYLKQSKALILPYLHGSQSYLPFIAADLGVPMISTLGTGISTTVQQFGGVVYPQKDVAALEKILLSPLPKSSLGREKYLSVFLEQIYQLNKV